MIYLKPYHRNQLCLSFDLQWNEGSLSLPKSQSCPKAPAALRGWHLAHGWHCSAPPQECCCSSEDESPVFNAAKGHGAEERCPEAALQSPVALQDRALCILSSLYQLSWHRRVSCLCYNLQVTIQVFCFTFPEFGLVFFKLFNNMQTTTIISETSVMAFSFCIMTLPGTTVLLLPHH